MRPVLILAPFLLAACAQVATLTAPRPEAPDATADVGDPLAAPLAEEAVPDPDQQAAAPAETGTAKTIVSLGDPARSGAWMETPLVSAEQRGEVRHAGRGVAVTLLPAEGPPTAGSRLSLGAMQALGLPLTELTEVEVVF